MTNQQRIENDQATIDKRKIADRLVKDNRIRNDELTDLRRSNADTTIEKNRVKNDELTANRRVTKDGKMSVVDISLVVFIVLAIGAIIFLV